LNRVMSLKNEKPGKYKVLYDALFDFLSDDEKKELETDKVIVRVEYGAQGI